MLKKTISFLVIAAIAVSALPGTAVAQEEGPMSKLGRGLLNVLGAVVEVPGTMMREGTESGAASGLTKGVVLGVVNTVVRALVGVWEVATFPAPNGSNGYGQIIDDPQFLSTE